MGFPKLSENKVDCCYCGESIEFGQRMELALPGVRPAHQSCNEQAYAEEEAQEENAR